MPGCEGNEVGHVQMVDAAVLLSGSGRTLENFLARIQKGELPIRIVAVVSSRPGVRGLQIAGEAGIPAAVFRRKDYPSVAEHNAAINGWLAHYAARMILLAGYLCYYVPPSGFAGPVLNIHPALLPRHGGKGYYGDRVHAAVLAAGERESGCTVHLVDEVYDHGKILGQRRVPVLPGDDVHSLAARVFAAECELYPEVVARIARQLLAGEGQGESQRESQGETQGESRPGS
jgi:phosphoribosylglycinamide formyltransferase-1